MQLSRTLGGCNNTVHGKEFPMNSVILHLENGTDFVCTNFRQSRKNPLRVYCYTTTEKKWVITLLKGNYKEIMWDYNRKCERKHRIRKGNYANMMKHDRVHKSGGGGSRICNGSITDYECAKNPLHDFRRCYN